MSKRIDKDRDDKEAGIRFHTSSARLPMEKVSYVAFQRWLDNFERAMFLCPECQWRGRGRDLIPMERDTQESYDLAHDTDTWYACPRCECVVPVEQPIMKGI